MRIRWVAATLVIAWSVPALADPDGGFFALGFGPGELSGHGDVVSSSAVATVGVFGYRVSCDLDFVGTFGGELAARYSPDPTLSQNLAYVAFGIRWRPFRARSAWFDPLAFYLQADAGLGLLSRNPYTFLGRNSSLSAGVLGGGALGWMARQWRGFAFGLEVSDRIGIYSSDEGVRHAFGAVVLLQGRLSNYPF